MTLLLIILMAASLSSCKNGAPKPPNVPLFQPVIDLPAKDKDGNPIFLNYCAKWVYNEQTQEWSLEKKYDVKKCNGTFGVDTDGKNKIDAYNRELQTWIGENCGNKNNRQFKESNIKQ